LNLVERERKSNEHDIVKQIISSYSNLIIRLYSTVRFRVIPLRFLNELSQYIPEEGQVLDLGCGFGLFTLYFAALRPKTQFLGVDFSRSRIAMAHRSSRTLGLKNATFICSDIRNFDATGTRFNAVITLDLMHHLPVEDGNKVIEAIQSDWLSSDGLFIMKDVTTWPRLMLYFTFALDFIMNPRDSFYYRSAGTWINELTRLGFAGVERHYLWDILPYPHILLVARNE